MSPPVLESARPVGRRLEGRRRLEAPSRRRAARAAGVERQAAPGCRVNNPRSPPDQAAVQRKDLLQKATGAWATFHTSGLGEFSTVTLTVRPLNPSLVPAGLGWAGSDHREGRGR